MFAILHPASGRRDGWYTQPALAQQMLQFWRETFPRETFHMEERGDRSTAAQAQPLRTSNAGEWAAWR